MSGDVQPRKRKDKKKAKRDSLDQRSEGDAFTRKASLKDDEDIKVEHHHGVHETKMGKDDVHLHVHSDHGTGGHWCAKLLFFSLLAVLFGLVGIIILENRGSSDVDTPLSESRFSEYFDGWVDEHRQAHDDHRKTGLEDHDHDSPPFEEEEDHSEQDNEDEHDVTHEDSHDEEDDDDHEEEPIQSNEDEGVSDNDEDDEDREEEDEEENETIEDNKNEDDDDEEEADNYVERSYTRMKRDVDEVSDEGFDEAAGNIDDEDDEDNEIVENNENDNKDDDENDERDETTEPNETVQQTETIEEKDNDDDNNPGNDDEDRDDDDAPFEETSTNQKSALRSAEKQSETLILNKEDASEFAKNSDMLDSKTEAVPLIIEPNEIESKLHKTEQSSKVQERQSLLDNKSNTESVRKADEKSIVDEQIVEKDAEEILKQNQNILQTSDESKAVDEEQHPQHIDKTATNEHGTTQESIKGSTDPGKDEHDQHQNVKIEDVSHDLVDDQDIAETTKEHADGSSENLVVVNKMEKNIRDENQSIQKKIEESEVGGSDPPRSQAGETDEVKNIEQLTDGDPGTKKQLRHDEKLEQQTQEESEKGQAEAVNKNPSLADDIATKESKQLAKDKELAEKSSENNNDQDQSESVQELPKVSVPSTEEKIKQPEGKQKANENIKQSPKESQADLKKSGKDEDLSQEFTETKRSTRSASEHISGAKNKEDDDFDDEEQSLEQVVDNDAGEELHLRQKAEQEELAAKAAASQEEEESESAPQDLDEEEYLEEEEEEIEEEEDDPELQYSDEVEEEEEENQRIEKFVPETFEQLNAMYRPKQPEPPPAAASTVAREKPFESTKVKPVEVKPPIPPPREEHKKIIFDDTPKVAFIPPTPDVYHRDKNSRFFGEQQQLPSTAYADEDLDVEGEEELGEEEEIEDEDLYSGSEEDADEEVSDVDDDDLMRRLEQKYGKLPDRKFDSDEEEDVEQAWTKVRGPQSLMDDDAFLDEEIRRANEELFNDNLQSALRILESLIRKFPENPKALYGKAKVHDQLSAKYKNNQMLMDAIDAYRAVIKLDDKMDDAMFREVAERCLDRMRFKGMFAESVPIHRKLIRRFSNDPNVRNQLAVTYLLQNRYAEAKYMLHHTLMRWRDDGFAQAHYGFILKVHDNDLKNAVSLLREGIESEAEGTQDGRFYFALGDALYRLGEKDEAMQVYEKGAALKLFPSAYQRSLYNVNNLKAQPFWTPEETTYEKQLAILQRNWELIRKEGLSALGIQGLYTDEAENLRETGNWKQLELFARGLRIEKNCAKTPLVCNIIEVFPAARTCKRGQVKFSIMDPGTHVWPHCGPTNCRLRAHLGLVVPDGTRIRVASEERTWKAGEWLIFDDSFEHEVWHNGTSPRLVLIVDIWHPDLTKEQREGLSRI